MRSCKFSQYGESYILLEKEDNVFVVSPTICDDDDAIEYYFESSDFLNLHPKVRILIPDNIRPTSISILEYSQNSWVNLYNFFVKNFLSETFLNVSAKRWDDNGYIYFDTESKSTATIPIKSTSYGGGYLCALTMPFIRFLNLDFANIDTSLFWYRPFTVMFRNKMRFIKLSDFQRDPLKLTYENRIYILNYFINQIDQQFAQHKNNNE